MRTNASTRLHLNIQKWIFTLLLLCVLAMLGMLSERYHAHVDMTANQRNSLSSGSIELLQQLDGEVSVHIYARDEDPQLLAAIQEIMERYRRVKADFGYRVVNPDLDFQTAQADGVSRYGEIVIRYDGRSEVITSLGEQAVSGALQRLARGITPHIVFLAGHGERNPQAADNRGAGKLATRLRDDGFEVSNHHLLEGPLPANTTVLVIAGADREISQGERERIQAYIDTGGNLLWLVEPGELHGMQTLADELGLRLLDGMVVDNNVELRKTLQIQHPAIIPVLEYYPHAVSKGIDYNTLFPLARGVVPDDEAEPGDWQHAVLWRSFERSWSETGSLAEDIVFNSEDGDTAGPIPLAVAVERTLTDVGAGKAAQRIIVVGDTDFISNAYIGIGANLELAANLFDWLSGDDDLIAVDVKRAGDLQLRLSDTQVEAIELVFGFLLPAALLFTGAFIWRRRKRR